MVFQLCFNTCKRVRELPNQQWHRKNCWHVVHFVMNCGTAYSPRVISASPCEQATLAEFEHACLARGRVFPPALLTLRAAMDLRDFSDAGGTRDANDLSSSGDSLHATARSSREVSRVHHVT